jgi:deoxyribodipyrimidine photolyase
VTATIEAPALVWFRQDLRLSDNPELAAALERKSPKAGAVTGANDSAEPSTSKPKKLSHESNHLLSHLSTSRIILEATS